MLINQIDFSQLINNSLDAIILQQEGSIVYANRAFISLLGFHNEQEVVGKDIYDFMIKVEVERPLNVLESSNGPLMEKRMIRTDGKIIDVEISMKPYIVRDQIATQVIIRDITDRKVNEEWLRQSEKLSVIGGLASGIVHEIRNPLTAIIGFIQLMKSNPNGEYLDIIYNEIRQIEEITNELLQLSKPSKQSFSLQKVNHIVKEVIKFSENELFKRRIKISFNGFTDTDTFVLGNKTQLKQVILNLIKNGMEAINRDGEIHVHIKKDFQNVYISIRDTGIGIPPDTLHKIGQSYFTNKTHGTGLGLMVCLNIIKNHNGQMNIESKESFGTTFTISLPLAKKK
ncbi:ATP-binding protein [Cytobacillus sp. FJAT-54145]|uniref:histidine kinase n=1 Tax=Cytobacillus spartinae TaxID=3299023 RepID=A0ABW6KCT0_9BACI